MKPIYFLGIKALFAVFSLSLLFAGSSFAAKKISPIESIENDQLFSGSFSKDEKKILELINKERKDKRLNQLVLDSSLSKLARSYSSKMARENFFSHRDRNGKNLVQRAKDHNIVWQGISENLYKCKGFDDPGEAAVKGWIKSPSHRSNFLGKYWSTTGIGVAKSSDGTYYVTQIFLRL